MAEVLVEFSEPVVDAQGTRYVARACGGPMDDGRWQGWIEFLPAAGGPALRSARETTQPNRADTVYWATGLTPVYLEGALERTRKPAARARRTQPGPAVFDGPRPSPVESVLNPFSVYRKGEALLRQQLGALSAWHLANIVRDYDLSELPPARLEAMSPAELIELIVAAVRAEEGEPLTR